MKDYMSQALVLVSSAMEVSSRTVAEVFNKPHARVLHAVSQLEASTQFAQTNFRLCEYKDTNGRMRPEVVMTRDGFAFLCMGFTGAKAAQWKEKFLAAFNAMEKALLKNNEELEWKAARLQIKAVRKSVTNAVQDFVEYATAQGSTSARMYFSNITKMEYAALGMLDKQKTALGNFRDTLDLLDLCYLQTAEMIAKASLEQGMAEKMHYKEIYVLAKQKVTDYSKTVAFARPLMSLE
jgi:Rha family phage regulatory protein